MEQGQLKRKISELNELRTQIKKEEAKLADYIRAKLLKTTHTIQCNIENMEVKNSSNEAVLNK